jgi:hypothetical protein
MDFMKRAIAVVIVLWPITALAASITQPCRRNGDRLWHRRICKLRGSHEGRAHVLEPGQAVSKPNLHSGDLGKRSSEVRDARELVGQVDLHDRGNQALSRATRDHPPRPQSACAKIANAYLSTAASFTPAFSSYSLTTGNAKSSYDARSASGPRGHSP